jgi:hypothetical protein
MKQTPANHQLAVVIPAYKGEYLAKTLACLTRQTDQRFNLYICDDASPVDISSIARSVLGARSYSYHRFECNLGGVSLAQHWNRCVALAHEPWIWLFSDDDLMDDNCIEEFYKFLERVGPSADIALFDTWIVDETDKITDIQIPHLDAESWLEYAYGFLMNCRRSVMQQLVFRRSIFEKADAFLDLPLCWGTDHAAIIAFGRHQKIRRIPRARVFWRCSRQHISSDRSIQSRTEKLRAICLFLHWLQGQIQKPREHLFADDEVVFLRAMDHFLVEQIRTGGSIPALANWNLLSRTRAEVCEGSRLALLKYIAVAAVFDSLSALERAGKALLGRSAS